MIAAALVLAAALPVVPPASAGMSSARLTRLDGIVAEAIERKELPGAVVLVGRHGKVVFRKAYGHRALKPSPEPMTADTAFDLASVTKTVATATSVMVLVERGRVRLSDPVVRHLPGFAAGGGEREKITVEQLLTHRAGFVPDDPMDLYTLTPDEIFTGKYQRPLASSPGSKFVYSDVGYEVLAELVRAVSGKPLDVFARENVLDPLGMAETEFRPLAADPARLRLPVSRIAPTELKDGRYLRGQVHDPRAYALGGVAGHAGLFGTADDLARFCRAMLGQGASGDGSRVLSPAGVYAMTRPRYYGDADLRGLGWDIATSYSSMRGELFPPGSFGHSGWTGTSLWLDPASDTFLVILSNRNHPDGAGNVVPLRAKLATAVAAAITDVPVEKLRSYGKEATLLAALGQAPRASVGAQTKSAPAAGSVQSGLDVLEADGFKPIAGLRVALLTHRAALSRDGRSSIDVLASDKARAAGVTLVRLFAPEHGLRSALDEKVPDSVDERTGLPIRSLYGDSRRVAPEDLAGLDAVVVDLQDVGVRFYTYLTTLGYLMEDAGKTKVKVVVLDRPDPIRADRWEGPPADADKLSFTAYHPIPIRTGMTIGELARLFKAEKAPATDLTVVAMKGYRRDLWHDETGLPWENPSPNLRSVTEAALYPGVALLETTNVSVGRGTETPFEVVGAPFVDGPTLARTLSARSLRGVRFTPVRFTPASAVHKGASCGGVRITLVDRDALDAVALGLELATALRDLYPKDWESAKLRRLLVNEAAFTRFSRGESAAQIASGWAAELMEFEKRRAAYLLY